MPGAAVTAEVWEKIEEVEWDVVRDALGPMAQRLREPSLVQAYLPQRKGGLGLVATRDRIAADTDGSLRPARQENRRAVDTQRYERAKNMWPADDKPPRGGVATGPKYTNTQFQRRQIYEQWECPFGPFRWVDLENVDADRPPIRA